MRKIWCVVVAEGAAAYACYKVAWTLLRTHKAHIVFFLFWFATTSQRLHINFFLILRCGNKKKPD